MAIINDGGSFTPAPDGAPQQVTAPGSERATPEQIALARDHERELPAFAPKPMSPEQIFALIGKDVAKLASPPLSNLDPATMADPPTKPNTSSFKPVDHPLTSKLRRVLRPAVGDQKIVLTDQDASGVPVDNRETGTSESGVRISPAVPVQLGQEANSPDVQAAMAPLPAAPEPDLPPILPHMKAASNSDSPARGIPTAVADPNKKITGGFGVPGEGPGDYFPLDGTEVRAVAEQLMDELYARIQDDLRFSIACTYPRVSVRVELIIDAYGQDKPTVIPRVAKAHDKTVLQTAKLHGEEICFVVSAEKVEMTSDGQSVTPPNKMRGDLGLEIPRKQRIETPSGGSMWVDRSS